jgi:hypothetical protein
MLSSGTGQTESIIANSRRFKKRIIVNGISQVVPGYESAICIMLGIVWFAAVKFVVMSPEWVTTPDFIRSCER